MRNVPKLRFKEFSGDWEEKNILELCSMKARIGWQNLRKEEHLETGEFYLVTGTDFHLERIKWETAKYVDEERYLQDKNIILKEGDVLITKDGSIGKLAFIENIKDRKATLNNGIFRIRIEKEEQYSKYLFYTFLSNRFKLFLQQLTAGSTIVHLYQKDFEKYAIAYPKLKEQEKIADFLSSVDKKISITEEKLDLFKDYKKGVMQKIFKQELRFKDSEGNDYPEWEEKRLGDVFSFKQGYQIPFKEQIKIKEKGYVRYLYISDFFSDKNLLYVKDDGKEKITETDITVANTGNTAGSFYRGKSGILSNNMFNIQNDEKVVTNDFLFQFLGTSLYSNQLKTFFNSSGQPHLGHKNMSMIIINYPVSFEEQQKIANFLSSIDKKNDNLATELENLKEFKKGLLQQMFI